MKSFSREPGKPRKGERARASASSELRIAVSFKSRDRGIGLTKFDARVTPGSVGQLAPDPVEVERAIEKLRQRGFLVSGRGKMSVSVRGSRELFEETFGTELREFSVEPGVQASAQRFFFPPDGAKWAPNPEVANLIDDAYIQWPHIYMGASPAKISSKPPTVPYPHLEVLPDVPKLLTAAAVHKKGTRGAGIRVAMVDTGFAHGHPWFKSHKFKSTVVLAAGATNRKSDPGSHGTGESANVFANAPKVTFIGVKLGDDSDPNGGASLLEGFQEALTHSPHVISVSIGYDLRVGRTLKPLTTLPNSLKALEAEVSAAVASGVTVVFSAGNGHYSFPGMMPDVISAGGVHVKPDGSKEASDYASAFKSAIYSGRNVPDFCGLVGMQPHADYIMLPVPPGEEIDTDNATHDKTGTSDGWAVFSGTSAAAPQIAGICALLLGKNPSLTPAEVKAVLARTAVDVTAGKANWASDPNGQGLPASTGRDGATGAGLVDALAAWEAV